MTQTQPLKALYFFNRARSKGGFEQNIRAGLDHDSQFFGMLRLKKFGIDADFMEVERVMPSRLARFVRRLLGIYFVHTLFLPKMAGHDVVFSATAFGTLLLRALFRVRRPKWVVLDFNLSCTLRNERTVREKLLAYALSKVDGIVTISEAERDIMARRFPELASRIVFFYEATDPEFFAPLPEVGEQEFILSVGFDPGRDYQTLLDAVDSLGIPLVIAANPEALRSLSLPSSVEVRSFPSVELRELYAKARLVIVPLRPQGPADSMGTFAVIEAMSMGKAVIATDNLSIRSYIQPDVTGLLVPAHSVSAMRQAIDTLRENAKLRRRLGQAAREFVVAHCHGDEFAGKLAQFLTTVVHGGQATEDCSTRSALPPIRA